MPPPGREALAVEEGRAHAHGGAEAPHHAHGHSHSHGSVRLRRPGDSEPAGGDYDAAHDRVHSGGYVNGGMRAAMLGFPDGLVSVLSLILGIHGERTSGGNVPMDGRDHVVAVGLTGLAGLLAGAASMASGEWISTHTQKEAMVAQLALEKQHLMAFPAEEASELASYLHSHLGVSEATAAAVIRDIQSSENSDTKMLELHAKFEHGIDPDQLGSPIHSAIASYFSFSLGAAVPLIPWFLVGDDWKLALYISCALSAFALLCYDAALLRLVALLIAPPGARASAMARAKTAALGGARQLAVGALAAGTTYGIGVLIGHRRM